MTLKDGDLVLRRVENGWIVWEERTNQDEDIFVFTDPPEALCTPELSETHSLAAALRAVARGTGALPSKYDGRLVVEVVAP